MSIIEHKPTIKHLDIHIFLIGLFDLSLQERRWVKKLAFPSWETYHQCFFFPFFQFFDIKKIDEISQKIS